MRCFVPAPTFTTMYAHTLFHKFDPRPIGLFQHGTAEVLIADLARPFGYREILRVLIHPGRFIMGNDGRIIATAALSDIQISYFRDYITPDIISICDDKMIRIVFPDCFGGSFCNFPINIAGHRSPSRVLIVHIYAGARLIDQVKAYFLPRYIFIPFGPEIPMVVKIFLSIGIIPEVVGFIKTGINTKSRRPVQV